jgi:hypothetical protein
MPGRQEAKKDVVSCDKLRGAAHERYIRRFPNGTTRYVEDIALEREPTRRTETSKYPEEKKITNDSPSSGERTGNSPNRGSYLSGLWGRLGVNPGELPNQHIAELSGKSGHSR